MKYLNLSVSLGRDESMLRSTPSQIGIWFMLQIYCHDQMNGGIIQCCHEWPDHMWERVAGTTAMTIADPSPLWHFSSMVLVVHHYDLEAELSYKKKQRMGKVYVERRWTAQRERKIIQISSGNSEKPQKDNAS